MTFSSNYKSASSINSLGKGDAEEVTWFVIETLASANDTISGLIKVAKTMREFYGLEDEHEHDIIANPYVLANGHSGRSPYTRQYLTSRGFKNFGGGLIGIAGELASSATVVDLAGIAQHGNATASTTAHLMQIKAIGGRHKQSQTVTRWMDAIVKAKGAKIAVRGSNLAAAAIPVPALGLGVSIGTVIAKLGIKVTLGKLIARTSMELHWRARQEQFMSGAIGKRSTGAVGPASAMVTEIFKRRGLTRIFGQYETDRIIQEPGGWMALNDKLMLV